jgi:hypothetical protein
VNSRSTNSGRINSLDSLKLSNDADKNGSDRGLATLNFADQDCSIASVLKNPIKSGYLLAYCESQFSSESIVYLLDIDKFKDLVSDYKAWSTDLGYKIMDMTVPGLGTLRNEGKSGLSIGDESKWPSTKIPFHQFAHHVKVIWEKYLSSSAPHQICMPSKVLSNTLTRLENLHIYGPKVFDETTLDPIKTLHTDVLPRFILSPFAARMRKRLEGLYPLPHPSELTLKLPGKAMTLEWEDERITVENLRALTIEELFHERIVYSHFLEYSKTIYAEENVYFARALSIYSCHWKHASPDTVGCPPEAEEMAWVIFRFYTCPGSPFEITMSDRRRKEMMQALANPVPNMFKIVGKSTHRVLRNMYSEYSFSNAFAMIPETIKAAKSKIQKESEISQESSQRGCLSFSKKP